MRKIRPSRLTDWKVYNYIFAPDENRIRRRQGNKQEFSDYWEYCHPLSLLFVPCLEARLGLDRI